MAVPASAPMSSVCTPLSCSSMTTGCMAVARLSICACSGVPPGNVLASRTSTPSRSKGLRTTGCAPTGPGLA
jgi:hypothetical protein